MKALRWHGRGDIRLEDVPAPGAPSTGELLLDVEMAGICGTDVEEWMHGPLNIPTAAHPLSGRAAPITLGHETVGVIAEAGPHTSLQVGARVVVEANAACGACWWCRHRQTQLCPTLATKGLSDDGGLAEQMLAPETMCRPVPDHVAPSTAVFCEPLAVAVRAVSRGGISRGQTAAILGAGTIGQLTAQVARHLGANVVVVDPLAARRDLAAAHGAALVVHPDEARSAAAELTQGVGADVCFESSGAHDAVSAASELTRAGGRVVLIGVSTEPIALSPLQLIWREQTIVGSLSHVIGDFEVALELLASGAVQVSGLLTDQIPLGDIQVGLHSLRDAPADHLKIVAVPHPGPRRSSAAPTPRSQ